MVKGIFDELSKDRPRNHFTVGIVDDVTHTSLDYDPEFITEDPAAIRAVFYGLGSDGTVGANKNSIKIIGDETEHHAQGFFVYDSKKSGSMTTSHLRFGPRPIRSTYLISRANFVACHQFGLLERFDVLAAAEPGATFLLNSPYPAAEVWDQLPQAVQAQIIERKLKFFVIDGYKIAREAGIGDRINTIMQTCFFAISGVLPRDRAIEAIKRSIAKTYGKRGDAVVQRNCAAVDAALGRLEQVRVPDRVTSDRRYYLPAAEDRREFVRKFTAKIIAGHGDLLPVSAMPADGTYPTGTARARSATFRPRFPCGTATSASSAANASWSARTRSFAAKSTSRRWLPPHRRRSSRSPRSGAIFRARTSRSRSRRRTAPAAGCASRSVRSRTSRRPA